MMEQILNFFVTNAYADVAAPAAGPQAGGGFSFVLMFVVIVVFFYFAILRPQSKRAKEQRNLLTSLAKDDEVVIAGGMLGRITKIADPYLTLSIANNVEILVQKSSVVNVLPKGTLKTIES